MDLEAMASPTAFIYTVKLFTKPNSKTGFDLIHFVGEPTPVRLRTYFSLQI